jgi:AcrR family transcriptional regulator
MPARFLRQLHALRLRRDAELCALVAKAAEAGVSSDVIAQALGVSRSTLWRHYGDELQQRPERAQP